MRKSTPKSITHCIRCGTCCSKGGPTLHKEDKKILAAGHIKYRHLITIRKGEVAFTPVTEKLEPVKNEIIKIAGNGRTWECLFYDKNHSSCSIYSYRPLECRLLECRDTKKLISVIGKNMLKRADIIASKNPILKLVKRHENECSIKKAEDLISKLPGANNKSKVLEKLIGLVRRDLEIRRNAVSEFNLSLGAELFYFGRPLFKHLNTLGISIHKTLSSAFL